MKIYEIASSWDRVKVSKGAGLRLQRLPQAATGLLTSDPSNLMKSSKNLIMKIMKTDEIAAS